MDKNIESWRLQIHKITEEIRKDCDRLSTNVPQENVSTAVVSLEGLNTVIGFLERADEVLEKLT